MIRVLAASAHEDREVSQNYLVANHSGNHSTICDCRQLSEARYLSLFTHKRPCLGFPRAKAECSDAVLFACVVGYERSSVACMNR